MSEIKQTCCDGCKKIVQDPHAEVGWVSTTGSIAITRGRSKDGTAQSRFATGLDRDFCSLKCYGDWLKRIP